MSFIEELTLDVDSWELLETSDDLTGDIAEQGDASIVDWAGDPIAWIEGNGDVGFDDWKLDGLVIALVDGSTPDCDKLVDGTADTAWGPWLTDISAEETEERRDGKNVSQLM